jgi:peroxiredoxin
LLALSEGGGGSKREQAPRTLKRCRAGWNIALRVSFLIGLDGKIAHVPDTPNADTHLNEMKEAVEKLTDTDFGFATASTGL